MVACDCRLLWDGLTKKAAATASSDVPAESSVDSDEDGKDGKMMAAWRASEHVSYSNSVKRYQSRSIVNVQYVVDNRSLSPFLLVAESKRKRSN